MVEGIYADMHVAAPRRYRTRAISA